MTPENSFTDPALEQAMTEIRNDAVDPAVVEAAAARVWAKLAEAAAPPAEHIRSCADFQALIPEFRAGRLPEARAMLLQDHLHQCVACRRVYEGKVVAMPAPSKPASPARSRHLMLWAVAAAAAVASATVYIYSGPAGIHNQRAIVQALNGRLYVITASGFQPLALNQELPDNAEIRTAQDSDAILRLHDGSLVELRERSGFSTSESGKDLTVRLVRGSVIVEAAKRRSGHLYVDTADCHVAVTGTIFGVSAGSKGSRVSVIEGQVHVSQGSGERVLKPGDQAVTTEDLEPEPVRQDIAWSRNRDRYYALLGLKAALERVQLPDLRYSSNLLKRLPANTVVFASVPNLADYLSQVKTVFHDQAAQNPALGEWIGQHGAQMREMLEKVRAGSGYLGDELAFVAVAGGNGPVLFAQVKRDGFAQFLAAEGLPLTMESRNGFVVVGGDRRAVDQIAAAMDNASGGFEGTPFYARIAQAYSEGAGILLCADMSQIDPSGRHAGMRYLVAEQKQVNHQMEARATLGFDAGRTGPFAWLGDPGPMGSLDYVTPEATALGAFVVHRPAAILEQIAGAAKTTPANLGAVGPEIEKDLDASLGGEFAFSMDGPLIPVPSWKLIVEVYDPLRLQAAIEHLVANYNQQPGQTVKSIVASRESGSGGAVYYTLAGVPNNPLVQACYTFSGGYMIAAPSRALVDRALQTKQSGNSILRSSKFLALAPRDHYANFSGVVYHDLGTALAPLAGLLGGAQGQKSLAALGGMKPILVAVYAEPDSVTVATAGDLLAAGLGRMLTGNPGDWASGLIPFGQMGGTRERKEAYR